MVASIWVRSFLSWITLAAWLSNSFTALAQQQAGSHTNINRWCGKPYERGSPNFDPGGQFKFPKTSQDLLLDVQLVTRHSIYDSSEKTASFILDTTIQRHRGDKIQDVTNVNSASNVFTFEIFENGSDRSLSKGHTLLNSSNVLVKFDIPPQIKPRLKPYHLALRGHVEHGTSSCSSCQKKGQTWSQNYTTTAELYYLPTKRSGSTIKIDRLYSSLLVANHASNYTFQPLIPFGFYASCSDYLNRSRSAVSQYAAKGFNAVNPVCAFPDGDLKDMFDWLDAANVWYQYDMRGSYQNLSSITQQVPLLKDRPNLLTWYTADEPDGHQDPLDAPRKAYNLLKDLDPYHPTALVLNCKDFYFKEYTTGADIVMEDAYPVGINATYSKAWDTPCSETYGDCGCDDCIGSLRDVSDRVEEYTQFGQVLGGLAQRKPLWSVLQAFHGENYWSRDPTDIETYAMTILALNHGSRGQLSWLYPPSPNLTSAHSNLAKLLTKAPMAPFLTGSTPIKLTSPAYGVDAAYWRKDDEILVGVVDIKTSASKSPIEVTLPHQGFEVVDVPSHGITDGMLWTVHEDTLRSKYSSRPAAGFVILRDTSSTDKLRTQ